VPFRTVDIMQTNYRLDPISAGDADALRAAGGDCYIADSVPGCPCRQ